MQIQGRYASSDEYRYGFNGMEKDNEFKGNGNSYDFGARNIYDPRVSRFFATDPDDAKYPNLSAYLYGANNPIFLIDIDGRGPIIPPEWWRGNPGLAFLAGMLDEAYDSAKGIYETSVELFWLSVSTDEWHRRYGKQREEQWDTIISIFNDQSVRDRLILQLYEKAGIYIKTLSGANGADNAAYEQGKLTFIALTSVLTIGEINALFKTGKFTDDILKKLAKSGKFKPCGCFTSGTQVLTEDGYKNIEDIKIGDLVWANNEKTGEQELKRVESVFSREFSEIYRIHFGDEVVEATHEHPFFIGGKWLKVDELKEGDLLTLYDGTTVKIDNIELAKGNFNVYNFEVEDFHTYYVTSSNILVHNGSGCSWKSVKTFGHTFKTHGSGKKVKNKLIGRLASGNPKQSQWLDNQKAADFLMSEENYKAIANLEPGKTIDIDLPEGMGIVLSKVDGKVVETPATYVTVVRGRDNFIRTAVPKN